MSHENSTANRKHIVIIGAGFAGIEVARGLAWERVDITLIDRQNFHLFQPLLYQVSTAALAPAAIAEPIRRMVRGQDNAQVVLGEVTEIATRDRRITLADGTELTYDTLVMAAGATRAYFGHDEWEMFAPGLKTVADARVIRSRLLLSFERADTCDDPAERERLLTFAIVGGGPSGVELAGSIAELAHHALAKDFHRIDPRSASIILIESGSRILSSFPAPLSKYAARCLAALGVTVRTNCTVKNISKDYVETDDHNIPVGLTIWAAGVKASPIGRLLGAPTDKSGRIKVDSDLPVPGLADVYALGDIALFTDRQGKPLPGLAQVAKQQGRYLARALVNKLRSAKSSPAFVFHDRGNVAIVGRHAAVADFGWWRVRGRLAWLLWALIHIYLLAGLQHRLQVAIQWLWSYLTYDRGARLIIERRPASEPRGVSPC